MKETILSKRNSITTYLNLKKLLYFNFLENFSKENFFTCFLSIFRIYIGFHILKSVFISFEFVTLFQKDISVIKHSFPQCFSLLIETLVIIKFFNIPIFIYLLIFFSLNLFFGYLKNINFIFLFLLFKIYIVYNLEISNGGDNFMYLILLFMCFTNSWQYLSFVTYRESANKNFLSNLAVYSILIQLCVIYIVSGLHKVHSDAWFNGSATYYILNTVPLLQPYC